MDHQLRMKTANELCDNLYELLQDCNGPEANDLTNIVETLYATMVGVVSCCVAQTSEDASQAMRYVSLCKEDVTKAIDHRVAQCAVANEIGEFIDTSEDEKAKRVH